MEKLSRTLFDSMSDVEINRIARQTGFVKIKSSLDGAAFLKLLLRDSEHDSHLSLRQMSLEALDKKGNMLSRQAIDARFGPKSTLFMKAVFESFLGKCGGLPSQGNGPGWMDQFGQVLVKDGTRFDLPEAFSGHFKGFGGSRTSGSGICIQFEYDLKSGSIKELATTSANVPDCRNARDTRDEIQPGSLILRDLGYFGLSVFEEMNAREAHYISRLNTQVCVYERSGDGFELLDFGKLHQRFESTGLERLELDVCVGKDAMMPTRIVVEQVPQGVYRERMRRANAENRKKGFTMRREYASRQRFNVLMTNVGRERLPAEAVGDIYRLRWQVELVFKTWKSTYRIHRTHRMKYDRWMTLFYARMLVVLVHWQVYHLARRAKLERGDRLLSISKSMKSLRTVGHKITELVHGGMGRFRRTVGELVALLGNRHELERRKGRKNQQEIIDANYCIPAD